MKSLDNYQTVRFFTAAAPVNLLEKKQKAYVLDRYLTQLHKQDLKFQISNFNTIKTVFW